MSGTSKPKWQKLYQEVVDKGNWVLQVATVSVNGTPACRTMAFGSFLDRQSLILNTHARTFKAGHLSKHPYAEVCCWDAATMQQFRMRGPVTLIDSSTQEGALQAERQKLWDKLGSTPGTKNIVQWYLDPCRLPGRPLEDRTLNTQQDPKLVPATQLLVKIDIAEVDYVNLALDSRSIWSWQATDDHTWVEHWVNP